ncbi:GNAT family N-acetyltransferase [Enterovibrio norvegicus]|uniref:GNAT family N-acetyltransferase n=1 Tax=Enterovibrio norvegicus TaxID=188144 RepID=UPI000C81FB5F|nr:GNAT family N-acetyltransferase [Enterovibrio norvegicus]PML77302.1 GNAT family N-acetyltransferase [Enterovibrio norvegicus]
MDIQKITTSDLKAITDLVSAVSEIDVLPLLTPQGQEEYKARVLPDLATTLDEERFITIKAVSDHQLLGFAALRDGDYLTHLFVSHASQGMGLGNQMLAYLLNSTDSKEISLRSSINAVGFYQRHGFEATGEESAFNGIRFVPMSLVRN